MATSGYQLSPPTYYRELGEEFDRTILNLDSPSDFKFGDASLRDLKTRNFLLDFSDDEAWCSFNVGAQDLERLLRMTRPPSLHTRWINIWRPQEQKDLLEALARHYDFSPRLLGLMSSAPLINMSGRQTSETKSSSSKSLFSQFWSRPPSANRRSLKIDLELDSEDSIGLSPIDSAHKFSIGSDINQYVVANELYYYTSMDLGRNCKANLFCGEVTR